LAGRIVSKWQGLSLFHAAHLYQAFCAALFRIPTLSNRAAIRCRAARSGYEIAQARSVLSPILIFFQLSAGFLPVGGTTVANPPPIHS
jgi:hypothetical protein